jgi:hypothetical protein
MKARPIGSGEFLAIGQRSQQHKGERKRVPGAHLIEKPLEHAAQSKRQEKTDPQRQTNRARTAAKHTLKDIL